MNLPAAKTPAEVAALRKKITLVSLYMEDTELVVRVCEEYGPECVLTLKYLTTKTNAMGIAQVRLNTSPQLCADFQLISSCVCTFCFALPVRRCQGGVQGNKQHQKDPKKAAAARAAQKVAQEKDSRENMMVLFPKYFRLKASGKNKKSRLSGMRALLVKKPPGAAVPLPPPKRGAAHGVRFGKAATKMMKKEVKKHQRSVAKAASAKAKAAEAAAKAKAEAAKERKRVMERARIKEKRAKDPGYARKSKADKAAYDKRHNAAKKAAKEAAEVAASRAALRRSCRAPAAAAVAAAAAAASALVRHPLRARRASTEMITETV